MKMSKIVIFGFVFFTAAYFAGCSEDPVNPGDTKGTAVIDPSPDSLNATWTLTGPDSFSQSGNGDQTLSELTIGEYTLSWDSINGYITPSGDQQTLAADGTITFNGVYSEAPVPIPEYVLIPPSSVSMPATFTMGSTFSSDETPHQVTLSGRFNMASTEVTNGRYVAALQWAYDQNPPLITATTLGVQDNLDGSTADLVDLDVGYGKISFSGGVFSTSNPDRPVVQVSWYGSVAYCDWLSLQEGLPRAYDHSDWSCNSGNPYSAAGYRLPTEAEWEFACRAGTTTRFNTGDCLEAGTEANFNGSSSNGCPPSDSGLFGPADVGSFSANQWGLFDIHGNVMEWCNDWYGSYSGDETDPEGAGSGDLRPLRGGSFIDFASGCRSARRYYGQEIGRAHV